MDLIAHIKEAFEESNRIKAMAGESLAPVIAKAAELLAKSLLNGNKILICGNGGSAADAQHYAAELVNRFLIERMPLPCIALGTDTSIITAIANDYNYEEIFAKQISALGNKKDVLIAISTSGNSRNILRAVDVAHNYGLFVIALTGNEGGLLRNLIGEDDLEIRVPAKLAPRIQETHILILHCLCDLIDKILFPNQGSGK